MEVQHMQIALHGNWIILHDDNENLVGSKKNVQLK